MKKIKFGVLGVSHHFIRRVSLPVSKSATVTIEAIASRGEEKARTWAEKLHIPKWYGSYEALLADKDIEAVYISLPNNLHLEWIKKAARAGKQVLCEKPLTLNAREAEEAIEFCRAKKVKLMEAFMYKFHTQWQRARELLAAGEIGTPQVMHTFFSFSNLNPKDIRNMPSMGGGALYDIGCYAVSSARFLLGREPLRVLCVLNRDEAFQTDVLASGVLDFGAERATFSVGTQTFACQQVEVLGSAGRMRLPLPFNMYPDVPAKVYVTTGVGTRCITLEPCDQYRAEFEEFAGASGATEVPVPPADALNNMRVIDALFRSADTSQWQKV